MACERERCKICADTKFFKEFRDKLTDPEMKKQFNGLVDRMLCAEEELSIETIYSIGQLDLLRWYLALEEAYSLENVYSQPQPDSPAELDEWLLALMGMSFMEEWRNDIRDNFGPTLHDHIWGPLPD